MVLGLYTSTVFCEQIICSMPNQSAKRIMVPRFPGSCTSSNARQSDERTASGSKVYCGCSKIASTCWGVFNKLARERSSCETSTSSLASIPGCSWNQEGVAAKKRQGKCPSKSPTNLGPSARNTRSSLRIFFSSSEWIYFILFLLNDAIDLIFFCKAIKIFPIYPYFLRLFLKLFSPSENIIYLCRRIFHAIDVKPYEEKFSLFACFCCCLVTCFVYYH